jgi:hypothetical protein
MIYGRVSVLSIFFGWFVFGELAPGFFLKKTRGKSFKNLLLKFRGSVARDASSDGSKNRQVRLFSPSIFQVAFCIAIAFSISALLVVCRGIGTPTN